jgi:hypothetical protein
VDAVEAAHDAHGRTAERGGVVTGGVESVKIVMDESAVALLRRTLYAAGGLGASPRLQAAWFDRDVVACSDSYRMAVAYFEGRELPVLGYSARSVRVDLPKRGDWAPNLAPVTAVPILWRKALSDCRCEWSITLDRDALLAELWKIPRPRSGYEVLRFSPDGVHVAHREKYADPHDWQPVAYDYDGPTFAVDAMFFRDLLTNASGETVKVDGEDERRPLLVREPGITHALMPMRLRDEENA